MGVEFGAEVVAGFAVVAVVASGRVGAGAGRVSGLGDVIGGLGSLAALICCSLRVSAVYRGRGIGQVAG